MSDDYIPSRSIGDNIEKWAHARLGKLTASRIEVVMRKRKDGKPSQERENYKLELIGERLTSMRQEVFLNRAMLDGVESEPDAIRAYEGASGLKTHDAWFIEHPTIKMAGASPDRYVGNDGLLECKCLLTKNHLRVLFAKEMPEEYMPQVQFQLACCPKRLWVDFVSFDHRLPPELRLFVQRIPRDEEYIAMLEKAGREFLAELDADMKTLGTFTPLEAKKGDGREPEAVTGWSDNLPEKDFSSLQSLMASGLVRKGV